MSEANRVLLDTNVVIALFAGDPRVMSRLSQCQATFVPVPVMGELYHGALQSVRRDENLARLRDLGLRSTILPCGIETAKAYGSLRTALARKGKPIPQNDVWIAAIAVEHDLVVLTKDIHFTYVEGLSVEILK